MAIPVVILSSIAEKIPNTNKLLVSFFVNKDFLEDEFTQFILPDEKTKFQNIVNTLYLEDLDIVPYKFKVVRNNDGSINNNGKLGFQTKYVNYTLNQNLISIDVDSLNSYYAELFKPQTQDQPTLDKIFKSAKEEISNLAKEEEKTAQENLSNYSESKITSFLPDVSIQPAPIGPGIPSFSRRGEKPASATRRPVVQLENLAQSDLDNLNSLPWELSLNLAGVGGDKLKEPVPRSFLYPGDKEIAGSNNSGLQLTRDEKYKLMAHTKAGAVFLYAGKSTNNIRTEIDVKSENSRENILLEKPNDLIGDAAYLYLSQKSDSKALLRVPGGTYKKIVGDRKPQSLAVLKADDVVIISRVSGIRLITGTDKKGSDGSDLSSKFGIDLIAGTDDTDLQPLVKGDNLIDYLKKLTKIIDELHSTLYKHMMDQMAFNAAVSKHNNHDPFLIMLQSLGSPPINGGKNIISDTLISQGKKVLLEQIKNQQSAINTVFNKIGVQLNYSEKFGDKYILSQKNRTN